MKYSSIIAMTLLCQCALAQGPEQNRTAAVRTSRNANDPASDATLRRERGPVVPSAAPPVSPASPGWPVTASPAPRPAGDEAIAGFLKEKLSREMNDAARRIDVRVDDGIATLSGTVQSLQTTDAVARIAARVRGVRAVVDRLKVDVPRRTDEQIREDAAAALLWDPVAESYEITPTVRDGVVTLTGSVQSYAERDIAADVIRGVRGVKRIDNRLGVRYRPQRGDPELAAEVQRVLRRDPSLRSRSLSVDIKSGRVMLRGDVGSLAEKERAERLSWVMNVRSVDASKVTIRPELVAGRQPVPPDAEIRGAVVDALVSDPRVLSLNPTVQVKDGVVTLTGQVSTIEAKLAADRCARFAAGVRDVVNLLSIRPDAPRGDPRIQKDVEAAFSRDSWLADDAIRASVTNGAVTLTGMVDSRMEAQRAERLASQARGVSSVLNLLRYSWWDFATPSRSTVNLTVDPVRDEQIRRAIESEMLWSPFVDADQVHTSVRGAVATLDGAVDSWSERNAAIANAREGGAYQVIDKLRVSP